MENQIENLKDIVIIGAGPTGLGVSLGLILNNSTRRTTIIEKNSRVGGLSGSFEWKDHTIDFGPHRLSPNIDTIRVLAQELLGPDCLYEKSQHGVQLKGKLYQFPPRVSDWITPLSAAEAILYFLSFLFSKIVWVTRRFDRESFGDSISNRFGRRFYKHIVAPMTEKVWISPEEIDQSFVAQRFSLIRPLTVIRKLIFPKQDLNPSHFLYPRKGFQQLWDQARDFSTSNGHVLYSSATPKEIEVKDNKAKRLVFQDANGAEREFELSNAALISTIPISAFLRSIRCEDDSIPVRELIELSGKIKYRSMILVCMEFDQEVLLPFRTQIYPEKEFIFNRLFEQNKYSRDTVASGKSVVVADITYPLGGWADSVSDDKLIEMVKENCKKLKYLPLHKLLDAHVRRVTYAYVVPDKEGKKAMFQIRHSLKKLTNVHFAGRFSVGEYDNSDYALMNGINLASFLSNRISRMEYLRRIHLQFNPIVG